MNWEAIGAVGEVGGAIAVVATLGYLAAQVRQNSRAIRSSTRSDIAKAQIDYNVRLAENPELAAAVERALAGDDHSQGGDFSAAYLYIAGAFRSFENQFYAYRDGDFATGVWLGYRENMAWNANQPGFAGFWATRRRLFSAEFVRFVETELMEATPRTSK